VRAGGDEHLETSVFGADFGNINMKIADRIFSKFLPGRFVAFNFGQPADAVSSQTAMQTAASQIRVLAATHTSNRRAANEFEAERQQSLILVQ
jgi:hypothetical protein